VEASGIGRQPLRSRLSNRVEIVEHGKLPTTTEEGARTAVGADFSRQPHVRHDRKTQVDKISRLVREGTQAIETLTPRFLSKCFSHVSPDTGASMVAIDHERSNLGQRVAQRSQFATGNDPVAMDGDEKTADMALQLIELSWKKVSVREM
jgi:hypothetical protein